MEEDVDHGDGTSTRYMAVMSIPNGHVVDHYNQSRPKGIHKVLKAFIEKGLVT